MGGMQALEWGAMYPARVRSSPRWRWVARRVRGRSAGAPSGGPPSPWIPAGAAASTTTPSPATDPTRVWHSPGPWRRSPTGATNSSPSASAGRSCGPTSSSACGTASAWRAIWTTTARSWCGASTPTRTCLLNKAMDTHDIGRGRGGLQRAVARITMPVLTVSISSDTLYPPRQQTELRDLLVAADGDCSYAFLESPHGHDGFLVETRAVSAALAEFLESVEKDHTAPGNRLTETAPGLHCRRLAGVAQLVERHLAKVKVAGSSPVARSQARRGRVPGGHTNCIGARADEGSGLQSRLIAGSNPARCSGAHCGRRDCGISGRDSLPAGPLAQLARATCMTRKGSGVQVPHGPPEKAQGARRHIWLSPGGGISCRGPRARSSTLQQAPNGF